MCSTYLSPNVFDIDDQEISFTLNDNGHQFGFSVVYASTDYIKRRQLWHNLTTNLQNQNMPWSIIGDFNTIIGSHEYRGSHTPTRLPMEDFANWTNDNNLLRIPTRGCDYT